MTAQFKILIALSCLVLLSTASCKKRLIDKRNKYIGEWQMREISDKWSLGRTPMHIYDTIDYVATVYYKVGLGAKGTLEITNSSGDNMHFLVKENGELEQCSSAGTISENNLLIVLNRVNTCSTGMGSGANYTYEGTHK